MFVSRYKDNILFCTPFSEQYELIQKFSGIEEFPINFNHTVNFTEAGLKLREKLDVWHIDIPLAISNDEAPPVEINGMWLGANHEFYGAVSILCPSHDKSVADIGSVWRDDQGTVWVLISVSNDTLTLISENIGEGYESYAFKNKIPSDLTYVGNGEHTTTIRIGGGMWNDTLKPIIRHTRRQVTVCVNGVEKIVSRDTECDSAKIYEEYEIVNPASMAEEICNKRPEDGYKTAIYSAMGSAMAKVSRIYHIQGDGTILCEFKIEKLTNISFSSSIGAMFQEKIDAFGGGIYRYIPKMKPIDSPEGVFDFSVPVPLSGNFPRRVRVTSEYWENPESPPDRIVDYFYNKDGKMCMGFACGYLPLYDGVPGIRAEKLSNAVNIVNTRKAYPIFTDADVREIHGVAYRKYFEVNNQISNYTIPYGKEKYIFEDKFGKK